MVGTAWECRAQRNSTDAISTDASSTDASSTDASSVSVPNVTNRTVALRGVDGGMALPVQQGQYEEYGPMRAARLDGDFKGVSQQDLSGLGMFDEGGRVSYFLLFYAVLHSRVVLRNCYGMSGTYQGTASR